jgi:hypothetical protein
MRWCREAQAAQAPLLFKVLMDLRGIPAHLWDIDIAQRIVKSSPLIIQAAPASISMCNMKTFTVVAWCIDPDLIAEQVVLVVS